MRSAEPPLDPAPDEARDLLRRELLEAEYNTENIIERILDWFGRRLNDGVDGASNISSLSTLAGFAIFMAIAATLVLVLSRFRRASRAERPSATVLTDEVITAADLRARAEAALAAGDASSALVDAYRALAVRHVERGLLPDNPGMTALEVARALGTLRPEQSSDVYRGAELFDAVLYGDREATVQQAREVLALGEQLAGVV